ncbi:MAG: lipoate--protein ligase family protein [Prevotella sp.]|nr:lipoate--protein ligase family protein [Prevotella sp.]
MLFINLPEAITTRKLSFYLAMEEFVARHFDADDCFFMWRVEPSVIFGRNQQIENEVNMDYCRRHRIQVYRRKSGGGCVYADKDNVMLSYISNGEQVGLAFNRFISMMLLVFRKVGVDAVGTRHNDILIGGRKVCGTACYHLPGKSIVHSTMLYDTNMEHMLNAITPSTEKLQSKGIQSVRQRITLLKDYVPLNIEETMALIRTTLCSNERTLTLEEVAAIEQLEENYLREEFIYLM